MHHEDPNRGPTHSPPAPTSPSYQPMVTPQLAEATPPTNPSHQMPTSQGLTGISRPKPRFQPLEIPPRPLYQPGLLSPTPHSPSIQPLEIPPRTNYQQEVMSPTPHSPSREAAATSPKPQSPSPILQHQPVAMSPTGTAHRQSGSMLPTPHNQPMMMMPPPDYQPYMFPPPPYYHPGPPYNIPMMQAMFQAPNHYYPEHERAWSTELFDCTKDIRNCSRTVCCPCVTFGQIAEIVNEGTTPWYEPGVLCALLAAVTPCFLICHASFPYTGCYRTKLRKKYKLKGSDLEDCLVHSFCECCALCQEYRELDHQGFDVPLGWHENKRRERQAVAIFRFIPPEEQGMTR